MKKMFVGIVLGVALVGITAPVMAQGSNYEQQRLIREAREAEAARVEKERAYKLELMKRGGPQAVQAYEQERAQRRTQQDMQQMQMRLQYLEAQRQMRGY